MALGSNNPFPSALIVEGTAPASPAAGQQRLYIDSTSHTVKRKNSSGTIVDLETGGAPAESAVTFTDIATNNSSTSKHGYLKKLSNAATDYMDGTGAWSVPAGSGGAGTSARGHIYHNATQTVANGVEGALAFNSERSDASGGHDTVTNNSRVIPLTAGRYAVTGSIQIDADLQPGSGNAASFLAIQKNATDYNAVQVLPMRGNYHSITAQVDVNGSTDYFELHFFNASGATRTVSASSATGFSCDLTWTQI